MSEYQSDIRAIKKIVEDLFASLCWDEATPADWDRFRAQAIPKTVLFPSARPVNPTLLAPFIEMMQGQRDSGALRTFVEAATGHQVLVFGNIAVALSAYTQQANGGGVDRGVNGFLFIREAEGWKIAAMCWDKASEQHPIPPELLAH